jgi:hypothetical protein
MMCWIRGFSRCNTGRRIASLSAASPHNALQLKDRVLHFKSYNDALTVIR